MKRLLAWGCAFFWIGSSVAGNWTIHNNGTGTIYWRYGHQPDYGPYNRGAIGPGGVGYLNNIPVDGNTWQLWIGCADNYSDSHIAYQNNGGDANLNFSSCSASGPDVPTVTNYFSCGCITNTTGIPLLSVAMDGIAAQVSEQRMLQPGEYWCRCATNSSPFTMQLCYFVPGTDAAQCSQFPSQGYQESGPGSGPGSGGDTGGGEPPIPPESGTTNPASIQGQDEIVKAIQRFAAANHADLTNIAGHTKSIQNNTFGSMNFNGQMATNGVGGGGSDSNLVNHIDNVSSNVARLYSAFTNHFSGVSTNVGGFATNAGVAEGQARGLLGGIEGVLGQAGTNAGAGITNAMAGLVGSGSASDLSFMFCGQELNLDPEVRFPGLLGAIKAAWTFLVLVGFAIWAGHYFTKLAGIFASAQTGGVPNLTVEAATFGGNVIGVTVFALVCIAFITLWVVVLTFVSNRCLESIVGLSAAGGALGLGGNQTALYLLNASFPVALGLGLLGARVTVPLVGAKLLVIAAGASRFLMGK